MERKYILILSILLKIKCTEKVRREVNVIDLYLGNRAIFPKHIKKNRNLKMGH